MTYQICVYKNYTKDLMINPIEVLSDHSLYDGHVYCRMGSSITVRRFESLYQVIKHILTTTNYYFEILED
jgi:hypothetical protein